MGWLEGKTSFNNNCMSMTNMDSTYNLENTQSNQVNKSKIDQIITKLWKATVGGVRKAEKIMIAEFS